LLDLTEHDPHTVADLLAIVSASMAAGVGLAA
jgi:hypothetical protein